MLGKINIELVVLSSSTIIILPWFLIDASTIPKYSIVLIYAAAILFLWRSNLTSISQLPGTLKLRLFPLGFFLICVLASFRPNNGFWSQQLFGAYGRNTGIILYVSFIVIMLRFILNQDPSFSVKILRCFVFSGLFVNIYFILQYFRIDFAEWESTYTTPSSFLGNPNFVSSFSGLTFGVSLILLCNHVFVSADKSIFPARRSSLIFTLEFLSILTSIFVLSLNDSAQGRVVAVIVPGTFFALYAVFRYLKYLMEIKRQNLGFITLSIVITLVSVASIFCLAKSNLLLQRYDVQIRIGYWRTALRVVSENPFGIGFDAFGDYFETYKMTNFPSSFVNSSHNVFLDMAVNGGIPLFLAYLVLMVSAFTLSIKRLFQNEEFEINQAASISLWVGLISQSLVSINQISIALWMYVFTGLLMGIPENWSSKERKLNHSYSQTYDQSNFLERARKKIFTQGVFSRHLTVILSTVLLILSFLPLRSDFNFRESLYTRDLKKIENAARVFPTNNDRLLFGARVMCLNGDSLAGLRLAQVSSDLNVRDIPTWEFILRHPEASPMLQRRALDFLSSLEPNEPAWKQTLADLRIESSCGN